MYQDSYINSDNLLDPEINQNVISGSENKAVQTAINVIQKNNDVKIQRDNKNFLIQKMFEEGFEVADPKGTRLISSQMIQQAFWRTANRMKPLDFEIFGTNRDKDKKKIVTQCVSTIMENGGHTNALRDKDGLFQKLLLYGDGFMYVGTSEDNDLSPICFSPISNSNVYLDSYGVSMRGSDKGSRVRKMIVIFSMSWATFCKMYPKGAKIAGVGSIPRDIGLLKELQRNYYQTFKLDDLIEVAHYYDIENMNYTIFAGSACTVLEEYEKKDYPFFLSKPNKKEGEAYIPVIHYLCMPSSEGFYNHGIGDALYKLARLTQQLMNMATGHINDNTYPITLVNVPTGEASKFFNKLELANQMRAAGKKPVVAMEYDQGNPNSGRVESQSLLTQNLLSEWQIVYDRLDKEVSRLGINLDDIERGDNITASQVLAEEESSNAFVKQIMEYNATEAEFTVNLTLDFIKKFIKKNNDTPINLTTPIQLEDGTVLEVGDLTMGAVADELNQNNYFTKINARTGAIPSNIMQQTEIQRVLGGLVPGSQAWAKTYVEFAKLNNRDIKIEDLMPQAPPQQPAPPPGGGQPDQGASEGDAGAPPSETDKLAIDPRASNPAMAFQ